MPPASVSSGGRGARVLPMFRETVAQDGHGATMRLFRALAVTGASYPRFISAPRNNLRYCGGGGSQLLAILVGDLVSQGVTVSGARKGKAQTRSLRAEESAGPCPQPETPPPMPPAGRRADACGPFPPPAMPPMMAPITAPRLLLSRRCWSYDCCPGAGTGRPVDAVRPGHRPKLSPTAGRAMIGLLNFSCALQRPRCGPLRRRRRALPDHPMEGASQVSPGKSARVGRFSEVDGID